MLTGRQILVDDARVRGVGWARGSTPAGADAAVSAVLERAEADTAPPAPECTTRVFFDGDWVDAPVYSLASLPKGLRHPCVFGGALIVAATFTVVVEVGWAAEVTADGDIVLRNGARGPARTPGVGGGGDDGGVRPAHMDPVTMSVFAHRFMGIAEQMGKTLQRTAISVNMKVRTQTGGGCFSCLRDPRDLRARRQERLDFSCALFDRSGGLVANAPHIPVHLGAMQVCARAHRVRLRIGAH